LNFRGSYRRERLCFESALNYCLNSSFLVGPAVSKCHPSAPARVWPMPCEPMGRVAGSANFTSDVKIIWCRRTAVALPARSQISLIDSQIFLRFGACTCRASPGRESDEPPVNCNFRASQDSDLDLVDARADRETVMVALNEKIELRAARRTLQDRFGDLLLERFEPVELTNNPLPSLVRSADLLGERCSHTLGSDNSSCSGRFKK
jgi:hypothetical protein